MNPRTLAERVLPTLFLSSALALSADAQTAAPQPLRAQHVPSVRRAVYSLAAQAVRPSTEAGSCAALAPAFTNTDTSGFYATGASGQEWLDYGVIPEDTGSELVGAFTFGYGTTALGTGAGGPGAAVELSFYDDVQGGCQDRGSLPVATFQLTGLPGASAPNSPAGWILTIDLSGGFEFEHAGAQRPFGFSFKDIGTIGQTVETGPLTCYAGDRTTQGPDSNGQIDRYDAYEPNVATGTCSILFFGGAPFDYSSWYLTIDSVDASASTEASVTVRNTNNPEVYAPSSLPVLGDFYTGSVLSSCGGSLIGLVTSQSSASLPTAFGDLLLGADPQVQGLFPVVGGQATVLAQMPTSLEFCGLGLATQTFELGCINGPQLHNAVDVVLGF